MGSEEYEKLFEEEKIDLPTLVELNPTEFMEMVRILASNLGDTDIKE